MRWMFAIVPALVLVLDGQITHAQELSTAPELCRLKQKGPGLKRLGGTVEPARPCSGSLVTVKGRSSSAQAWVMTNGHCVGTEAKRDPDLVVSPVGTVVSNLPFKSTFTLETGNPASPRACVGVEELLYATMTKLDFALYRLTETYEAIEKRTGVKALVLSSERNIPEGTNVYVPSAWWQDVQTCTTGPHVQKLREGVFEWGPLMAISRKCEVRNGTSGSPVLRVDNGEVVGLQGTMQEGIGAPCSLDNPCEVSADGKTTVAEKGTGYMHLVDRIYSCLNDRGELDWMRQGCDLPKP